MSIFKQKRETTRKALIYYLEVFDVDSERPLGRLVDITTGGFQMVSETSLDAGKSYRLKIVLPEEIQGTKEIPCDSRCVRCVRDLNSKYFYSGFQFKDLDEANVAVIEKLISQFEF